MRTILPFLFLLFMSVTLHAQNKAIPEKYVLKSLSPESKLQYQGDYVRHCLKNYRNCKMNGYKLILGGSVLTGAGVLFVKNDSSNANNSNVIMGVGGALSLIGFGVLIDAEKWMKRAYIGSDGLGVVFKF